MCSLILLLPEYNYVYILLLGVTLICLQFTTLADISVILSTNKSGNYN